MNAFLIALQVIIAVIAMATIPLALRRRWRLFIALPLAVFQLYLPGIEVAGFAISLAFWGGLTLWPDFVSEFGTLVTWKPTAYILGIIVLYVVSLLWSPDPKLGLQAIGYFIMFLMVFSAVVREARRDDRTVLRLLCITVVFALFQALSVVVFFLMPGVKLSILTSAPAKLFLSPNVLGTLITNFTHYNALNPGKSGGLITLASNDATPYLGALAFTALGLALHFRKRWLGAVGVLLFLAAPFTGSKAGLVIGIVSFLLALQLISMRYRGWRNRMRFAMILTVLVGAVAWLGPKAIQATESGDYKLLDSFMYRSNTTLTDREYIWAYTLHVFPQHPFRGLGFGGWELGFPKYARSVGLGSDLPPHNTIIRLWSEGGLLAALLGIAFIVRVLRLSWRQMRNASSSEFNFHLAIFMAFLWNFTQGMGENFGLLGIENCTPLLACLLALGYVYTRPAPARVEDMSVEPWNQATVPRRVGSAGSCP